MVLENTRARNGANREVVNPCLSRHQQGAAVTREETLRGAFASHVGETKIAEMLRRRRPDGGVYPSWNGF
jgi:hypothetical protein